MKNKTQILEEQLASTDPYNAAILAMDTYAQQKAEGVIKCLQDEYEYDWGQMSVGYAIQIIKKHFNLV